MEASNRVNYPAYDGTQHCFTMGVGVFYQEFNTVEGKAEAQSLKEFCSHCNIFTQCAEYAIRHERHGFWGGLTPSERDSIRKRTGIKLVTPENFSGM